MRVDALSGIPDGAARAALEALWVRAWTVAMPDIDFPARLPWFRAHLDGLLLAGAVLLVAREGDAPLGFLTLDEARGAVDQLAVDPPAGGRGVGHALMTEAKRRAPPAGLRLTVNAGNPRALRFYARAGFRTVAHGVNPASNLPVQHMAWGPDGGG